MANETFDIKRISRGPAPHTTIIVAAQVGTPTTCITGWTPVDRIVASIQPMEYVDKNKELQGEAPKGGCDEDDSIVRPDTGP